jgi:hypothetical protein
MELPPNVSFKVNAGKLITLQTNPLVSQRRKDLPVSLKSDLK